MSARLSLQLGDQVSAQLLPKPAALRQTATAHVHADNLFEDIDGPRHIQHKSRYHIHKRKEDFRLGISSTRRRRVFFLRDSLLANNALQLLSKKAAACSKSVSEWVI